MAASLLRTGRLGCVKCLQTESWSILRRAPAAVALSTKSGGSKKSTKKNNLGAKDTHMHGQDPFMHGLIQQVERCQSEGALHLLNELVHECVLFVLGSAQEVNWHHATYLVWTGT